MGQSSSLSHDSASGLRRSPFYALLKVQVALCEPQWKSSSAAAAAAAARQHGGGSEQRANAFLAQISTEERKLLLQPVFEHFGMAMFSRSAFEQWNFASHLFSNVACVVDPDANHDNMIDATEMLALTRSSIEALRGEALYLIKKHMRATLPRYDAMSHKKSLRKVCALCSPLYHSHPHAR
jgi:hypothetical protein